MLKSAAAFLVTLAGVVPSASGQTNVFPSSGNVGIGTTNPLYKLHVSAGRLVNTQNAEPYGLGLQYDASTYGVWLGGTSDQALKFSTWGGSELMRLTQSGNLGIGTTNPPHKLSVAGTVGAREVVVTSAPWSDYVFRPGYRLRPLSEVSAFIQKHRHLPDIPTEAEVKEKGIGLGEMQAKLLAKIEELTLHMIREHDANDRLVQENRKLQEEVREIRRHLEMEQTR